MINAQNIVTALSNNSIETQAIIDALANVTSTTFATLTQASRVKTAAKHNNQNIYKITVQNVTLCNSTSSLYNNAVTREVVATEQAQAFTAMPSNYDMIDGSYSVVSLKSNPAKHYLRAIVNKCLEVVYYCANTNRVLTKEEVAEYLTASAAKQLLAPATKTVVQHANIEHTVTVRTFAIENIYSINLNKQALTV
jgi:hypothetical protein